MLREKSGLGGERSGEFGEDAGLAGERRELWDCSNGSAVNEGLVGEYMSPSENSIDTGWFEELLGSGNCRRSGLAGE